MSFTWMLSFDFAMGTLLFDTADRVMDLKVSWYAVDRTTLISDYYVVESPDGGATLGGAAIISGGSTDFTGATGSQDFYGDYNASVRKGCNTWSVWGDGRTGAPMVYVSKTNTEAAEA